MFTVEQLRPRRASRGPNWCIRTGLAFRESATCSGLATPPMLHERRRWCGQSCGEVHGMGSQQRCADQGVRCVVRVGQSPRAACSSASAKSAAAVALQLLVMLLAAASTLETWSLDVASTTDAHSHAAPWWTNAESTLDASSSCRLAAVSFGIRRLSPSVKAWTCRCELRWPHRCAFPSR